MKKYTFILLVMLMSLLFSSCFITNTPGFYSGYKKLPEQEKNTIEFTQNEQYNFGDTTKIYAITGTQLSELLKKNDSTVVYLYGPNCSSKNCASISYANKLCEEKNYKLIVIIEYYNFEVFAAQHINNFNSFAINHFYYKTDYVQKYVRLFKADLLGNYKLPKEEAYYRFLKFNNDKLVNVVYSLEEL